MVHTKKMRQTPSAIPDKPLYPVTSPMNRQQKRAAKSRSKPARHSAGSKKVKNSADGTHVPMSISDLFAQAIRHHQAGRLAEAEELYRQIILLDARHTDSLHLLGVIAYQKGNLDLAVVRYEQALTIKPDFPKALYNLGCTLQAQGKLIETIARYEQALAIRPNYAEALSNLGCALQDQGRLDEAVTRYEQALAVRPNYAEALSNLGCALQAQGKPIEAIARHEQALAIRPGYAKALSNLGIALQDQGRLDEAVTRYEQALTVRPEYAEALSNLGNALNAQGKLDEAVTRYEQALAIKPEYAEALYNLGCALQDQNKLDEAIARYEQALAIRPNYAEALYNLGCSLQVQGKPDEAAQRYRQTIKLDPKNKSAGHLLASLTAETTQRAPSQYIEKLFDGYANKFDTHLVHDLKYKTPAELISLLKQAVDFPVGEWDVLDLGCGTGLAGLEISPYARRLVGVDLSSKMLARAHLRNLYHRLEHSDLLLMMQGEESSSYDVVIAADVFVYLGVLDDIVSEAKRLLRPGGFFIFTVEALEALSCDVTGLAEYKLNQSGRYAHSAIYLEKLSSTNGFSSLSLISIPVRLEKGLPITAWAAVWKS
jgi:predicted TPR repeat methyltransferase